MRNRPSRGFASRRLSGRAIGSGHCVNVAPEMFELGSDQIVTFRDDAHPVERERMIEACRVSPVDALFAHDEDSTQHAP